MRYFDSYNSKKRTVRSKGKRPSAKYHLQYCFMLGTVHKKHPQSGKELVHYGQGLLQMRTSALMQKTSDLLKSKGWASANNFRTRKEGVNFSRFCADVFYGRPLIVSARLIIVLIPTDKESLGN